MVKTTSLVIIPYMVFQLIISANEFQSNFPQPVSIKKNITIARIQHSLKLLNAPIEYEDNLVRGIYAANIATNIDPILIACLIKTESDYKVTAISSKKYKGLMQTPTSNLKWSFAELDIVNGSSILRSKLNSSYSNGDLLKALQLYKGGRNNEAMIYAKQTVRLYHSIKLKVNEMEKIHG